MSDITVTSDPGRPFPWHCPRCRRKDVNPAKIAYACEMAHDGRQHDVHIANLTVPRCGHCGEIVFTYPADDQIRDALRRQLRLLLPEEIRRGRTSLRLTQRELTERLGVAEATISRWETGAQIPTRALDNLLGVSFAVPAVRDVLSGAAQDPALGVVVAP